MAIFIAFTAKKAQEFFNEAMILHVLFEKKFHSSYTAIGGDALEWWQQ